MEYLLCTPETRKESTSYTRRTHYHPDQAKRWMAPKQNR